MRTQTRCGDDPSGDSDVVGALRPRRGRCVVAGGYLVLAFLLIPALAKGPSAALERLTETTVRVLTYAGTATIFFGLLLVTRTRGFDALPSGEWGGIIIACFVIAVALLGIGDGALRPALRRLGKTKDDRPAKRFALLGFALSVVAVGLMTRALYVPT